MITAIHSFRGGTGKSNITANLCAVLAAAGQRVGVIDTDVQSPGIHVLFGLVNQQPKYSLNSYLWGECEIGQAAYDVTDQLATGSTGAAFIIPSSLTVGAITRVLRDGYDVNLLKQGFRRLIASHALDVLLIDTHPGLNEETLVSMAVSDALIVVLRPDQQDYEGTSLTVEVGRTLGIPRLLLVVNKVPWLFDAAEVKAQVERAYNCAVAAVLPQADEFMVLASGGLFVQRYPDHQATTVLQGLARALIG